MLQECTSVGFSGHRTVAAPALAAAGISGALDRLAGHGLLAGVCSAASGGDALFLEEMVRRKLPFRLLLPFARARFEKDFSPGDWRRATALMDKAVIVEELEQTDSDHEAYHETGVLTVERADVLIFLWDGQPAAGEGGTGDIVEYARALEKPLIIVDPATGNLTEERLASTGPGAASAEWPAAPREAVEQRFATMNETAERRAPQARRWILWIIVLHLLASAIGIGTLLFLAAQPATASGEFKHLISRAALGVEIGVLVAAGFLAFQLRRSHHEWIRNRLGAELCRSFLAAWKLRRRPASFPRMTIEGCEKLAASLRVAWHLDRSASCDVETARTAYLTERVARQIHYYTTEGGRAERALKRWRRVASLATFFAILGAVIALALSFTPEDGTPVYLAAKLVSLLLPLVNAAALALIIAQEYSRRVVRYRQMADKLRGVARQLQHTRTWPSLFRVVLSTEDDLLQEVVEWHSYLRFAGDSH